MNSQIEVLTKKILVGYPEAYSHSPYYDEVDQQVYDSFLKDEFEAIKKLCEEEFGDDAAQLEFVVSSNPLLNEPNLEADHVVMIAYPVVHNGYVHAKNYLSKKCSEFLQQYASAKELSSISIYHTEEGKLLDLDDFSNLPEGLTIEDCDLLHGNRVNAAFLSQEQTAKFDLNLAMYLVSSQELLDTSDKDLKAVG